MIKKMLLMAAIYYSIIAISACCKCAPQANKRFIYSGLETGIYSCTLSDSTFQYEALQVDSLSGSKFGIGLSLEGTIVHVMHRQSIASSLVNTANACDCAETIFSTVDSISSIAIITLHDFDSSHTAGADVTAYFNVLDYDYSDKEREIIQKPIDSFLHYSYTGYAPGFYLNIYLTRPPRYQGYAQFKVIITCKNGKEFETETERVYLH